MSRASSPKGKTEKGNGKPAKLPSLTEQRRAALDRVRDIDMRKRVVAEAVELADAEGLEALSMRALAGRLGVATMTIYTYVENKDELIDLMLDEVAGSMLVSEPMPENWREALRAIALHTRDAVDKHPWAFGRTTKSSRHRLNMMRHVDQSLSAVWNLGLEPEVAGKVLMALDDYTLGNAIRTRAFAERHKSVVETRDPAVTAALDAGELPHMAKVFKAREGGEIPLAPPTPDFESGLDWLLDGIEAMLGGS